MQGNETANGGANNHLCADNIQIPAASSKTYVCRPKAYGRYLYIRISGNDKVLTLCEVEVYSSSKSVNLSSCLFCRYACVRIFCIFVVFFLPFTKQVICLKKKKNTSHDHFLCMYSCTRTLNINKLIQKNLQYLIFLCLRLCSKNNSMEPSAL